MENEEKVINFQNLLEGEFETVSVCKGNACSKLGLRPNFRQGQNTIVSVSAYNGGTDTMNVSITWGDYLGGCGTASSEVIFPGETIEIFTSSPAIIGYCKIKANFQSEEETEKLNLEGAQCTFDGHTYNDGETTCINDTDHRCRNGRWVRLGTREYCN